MNEFLVKLEGYQTEKLIYQSPRTRVYRALRLEDHCPIVIKLLKSEQPTPEEVGRFKQEFQLMHQLKGERLLHALEFKSYHDSYMIILEDFGGCALNELIPEGGMELGDFFSIAIEITQALGEIHQKNIIHKDIKPANILYDPEKKIVKICDFGQAALIPKEIPVFHNPAFLEGSLPYMSPEQTGRMNRSVDQRSDVYSLGVTFYELLTGTLPFLETDPLNLIYSHLAISPPPLQQHRSDIPTVLNQIILKMLSKDAERRYQSSYGLLIDLETCANQWKKKHHIAGFPLGKFDHSDQFVMPEKLYGREHELNQLLNLYDRVQSGKTEVMLVSGPAGIGKSALVQEIYKPITQSRGYFISGKFDQFQKNIPYSSLVRAFRNLVQQLLEEDESQLEHWRVALSEALGPNGQVIIQVIPEVEMILGHQTPVPSLGPAENQNRFRYVFQKFIQVFTHKEHPLVLFLDDLQWADSASLNLIQELLSSIESEYLFFIGAFRDNEMGSSHALHSIIRELQGRFAGLTQIKLEPLSKNALEEMVADTLSLSPNEVSELSEWVLQKTRGNPFFISEFLKSLHSEALLFFDLKKGRWSWDISNIYSQAITDNVVELMMDKLRQLPQTSQDILQMAACLGNEFDYETLAIVSEMSAQAIADALKFPLNLGIVIPLSDSYKWVGIGASAEEQSDLSVQYRFAHDRIQQAAYALIPKEIQASLHQKMGTLMLAKLSPEQIEHRLIDIANHLNYSTENLNPEEAEKLSRINYKAGLKAKKSAAFGPAYEYFRKALSLLAKDAWQQNYSYCLNVHLENAETAAMNNDIDRMNEWVKTILSCAKTTLDKVPAYEIQIQAYISQHKLEEAVRAGLEALKILGEKVPEKPSKLQVMYYILKSAFVIYGKKIEAILGLPKMKNEYKKASARIQLRIASPAYMFSQELYVVLACRALINTLQYGNSRESPMLLTTYSLILGWILGSPDKAYELGKTAIELVWRLNAKSHIARVYVGYHGFIQHWKEPLRETLPALSEGERKGLEVGDLEFSSWCSFFYLMNAFYSGKNLADLHEEIMQSVDTMRRNNQVTVLNVSQLFYQAGSNFMEIKEFPYQLTGKAADEEKILRQAFSKNDQAVIVKAHVLKLILAYHFGKYEKAFDFSKTVKKYKDAMIGTASVPVYHFYDSLTCLAILNEKAQFKGKLLRRVHKNQKRLLKWKNLGPMNYEHKYCLIQALLAGAEHQIGQAVQLFEKSIRLAKENNFIHETALACELAGEYYLQLGYLRIAKIYMREATYYYRRWGSSAKVKYLQDRHPQLIKNEPEYLEAISKKETTTLTTITKKTYLDIETILKANQILLGEIELDQLLKKLIDLLMKNAGSEVGSLMLLEGDELRLQVSKPFGASDPEFLEPLSIAEVPKKYPVCSEIVNYVQRTKTYLVLDDVTQDKRFMGTSYIIDNQPKSVLCIPLLKQQDLVGVVYLENNLSTHAFTDDRVEMVTILGTQAAMAISNVQAIAEREEKERLKLEQERLKMENELLDTQSKELEKLNATKDKFFSLISHDLRTPFNPIVTYGQMLAERGDQMKGDRVKEFGSDIFQAGNNALELLNNLLQWSRIESGAMKFEPSLIPIDEIASRNLELYRFSARQKGIELKNLIEGKTTAFADENMIDTVIRNLISNAIKFTPKGGIIAIAAKNIGDHIEISVSDSGLGMTEEQIGKLFVKETHFSSQGTLGEKGTGLGLIMCKEMVEKNQGKIWVKSQVNMGTQFVFSLKSHG